MEYEVIEDRLWDKSVKPVATFTDYMAAKKKKEEKGHKYIVRQKLVQSSLSVQTAEVYCFRFKGTGGWANYTVCEETGEFSIQSDWGDYSYRWNRYGLGDKALKEFLVSCDAQYIVDKFSYNKPRDFREKFDLEATVTVIKEEIAKARRERSISQERARALWDFTCKEIEGSDDCENIYLLHDRLGEDIDYVPPHGDWKPYSMLDFLGGDYMMHGPIYKRSHRYNFCEWTLVPFFQEFLRRKLDEETNEEDPKK